MMPESVVALMIGLLGGAEIADHTGLHAVQHKTCVFHVVSDTQCNSVKTSWNHASVDPRLSSPRATAFLVSRLRHKIIVRGSPALCDAVAINQDEMSVGLASLTNLPRQTFLNGLHHVRQHFGSEGGRRFRLVAAMQRYSECLLGGTRRFRSCEGRFAV